MRNRTWPVVLVGLSCLLVLIAWPNQLTKGGGTQAQAAPAAQVQPAAPAPAVSATAR